MWISTYRLTQCALHKCPDCDASGQVDGEEAVVDYVNGGSLVEVVATCLECEGLGFVVDDSGQEET